MSDETVESRADGATEVEGEAAADVAAGDHGEAAVEAGTETAVEADTETAAATGGEAAAEREAEAPEMAESDGTSVLDGIEVADEGTAGDLVRIDRLSTLLDESIELPGGYRIGIDPIVGILPVVGDLFASGVSVYIVLEAAYLGVPRATLARMALNVAVDTVFGSVPVVGPVFDAAFKANARNVTLLEGRIEDPGSASADRRVLLALGVAFVALAVALSLGVGLAAWWLVGEFGLT